MPRWEPDTRERLVQAALDLYDQQGYDCTTVSDIADRAGVTSRTYFRYFPDKREVLFASGEDLRRAIVTATATALETVSGFDALLVGITVARPAFRNREFVRRRESVISTSEELRERELVKLASIAAAIRALFVEAGSSEPVARMTAEAGLAVFADATRRWQDGDDTPYGDLVRDAARVLRQAVNSAGT